MKPRDAVGAALNSPEFPRLKGWGLIEAILCFTVSRSVDVFPRLKGWGLIEAMYISRSRKRDMGMFPRLKGWGLIEASDFATASST